MVCPPRDSLDGSVTLNLRNASIAIVLQALVSSSGSGSDSRPKQQANSGKGAGATEVLGVLTWVCKGDTCTHLLEATQNHVHPTLSMDDISELGKNAIGRMSSGQPEATDDSLTAILKLIQNVREEANAWAEEARYWLSPSIFIEGGSKEWRRS